MPRLYREAPLLSVWEGSGNVAALDTLRAMAKQPETLQVFFDELKRASGVDGHLDQAVRDLQAAFGDFDDIEYRARQIVGDMALALQASLLLCSGHPGVAAAFSASRHDNSWGTVVGTPTRGVAVSLRPAGAQVHLGTWP